MKLDKARTTRIIKAALKEDIGSGDVTTSSVIGKFESVKASIVTNEDCLLCGVDVAEWVINTVDYSVRFKPQASDGQRVYKGKEIAFLEGHAVSILSAERTMLNFLCLMSGIATKVKEFAERVKDYKAKIYDTRKTFPLLRYLEKYAVVTGGGKNHRLGLWDQVLVKDNHLKIAGLKKSGNLVKAIRNKVTRNVKIEIEVDKLEQFRKVLAQRPDIIMLDNMSAAEVKKAVTLKNKSAYEPKPLLEVSGGINLNNAEEYARTGIDRISVGTLTDSVESVDMSLEVMGSGL